MTLGVPKSHQQKNKSNDKLAPVLNLVYDSGHSDFFGKADTHMPNAANYYPSQINL